MIRAALVLAVLVCAATVELADAAATQRRTGGVRRIGRRTAAAQALTCSADAMERAMERARAGDNGWFDDVVSGLGKAVDAVNVVKAWECKKCNSCNEHVKRFGEDVIQTLAKEAIDSVGHGICAATFDIAAGGLCSAICLPIPVPGLTPIVCPPFVIYAHSQCTDIMAEIVKEIKSTPELAALQKAHKLTLNKVKALQPDRICTRLGLCPTTRKDC